MEDQMIQDSGRHKRKIAQEKQAADDRFQRSLGVKNPERDRSIRKAKARLAGVPKTGYANGYVPNFQGINDAIGREIRDGGVSKNQVRVHTNPDFITNTRDEPNGKVPNFANSEELKQMLSVLRELLQEAREKNQTGSAKERRGEEEETSQGTVNHKHSPLNINVSGSIQETNSNIDKEILAAVVKAVEKLRGGMPVAPPKAEAGV
jgi:hypothetical protein